MTSFLYQHLPLSPSIRHNVQFSFECFCGRMTSFCVVTHSTRLLSSHLFFFSSLPCCPFHIHSEHYERVGIWKMHTGHKCYLDGYVESVFFSIALFFSFSHAFVFFCCCCFLPLFIFFRLRFIWVVERITSYAMDRKKKNTRLVKMNAFRCNWLNISQDKQKGSKHIVYLLVFGAQIKQNKNMDLK